MKIFLLAFLLCPPAVAETARLASSTDWTYDDPAFGGFSAILLDEFGLGLRALSDRGGLAQAVIIRDDTGEIIDIQMLSIAVLKQPDGQALQGGAADSEGITTAPDGGFYVSFEGDHRIEYYATADAVPIAIPPAAEFEGLQENSGLEALASDEDGTLYAIPERSGLLERAFPVYRRKAGVWDELLQIPREPPFLVTGADIGPDGRLYVLERNFSMFGFSRRVRSFAMSQTELSDPQTIVPSTYDPLRNVEGIEAWRDPQGGIRLTMIADDNFSGLLRTTVIEYVLVD